MATETSKVLDRGQLLRQYYDVKDLAGIFDMKCKTCGYHVLIANMNRIVRLLNHAVSHEIKA